MSREIELWKAVSNDAALMELAAAADASDVAAIASLRKAYSAAFVSTALTLAEARRKAVNKFGDRGKQVLADVAGVEQASGAAVSAYKAHRIKQQLGEDALLADLCCGIGGDSMAMAGAGLDVIAIDRDPLRAWMANENGGPRVQAVCADVDTQAIAGVPMHIDPARRSEQSGRRAWRLLDYQPGPDVIEPLIARSPSAAVKLSPGVDVEELPWGGELEFISEAGRLVQAVLWCGAFAQVPRRATLIREGRAEVLTGEPSMPVFDSPERYLYTFDASVERAGLIGQLSESLGAPAIHPKLGLLTSGEILESPWTSGFELIERLPWRRKRVKQWLDANDGGLVEVKTRGKACDPDYEQRRLRGEGATPYTVFVLRFDTKVQALITRRIGLSVHEA